MMGAGWLAQASGLQNAEDAHGFEALGTMASFGLAFLAWLLAAVTGLVAAKRGARSDGPFLWTWSAMLASAAFAAAGIIARGAWVLREGFASDSVVHAALAVWTAAAGVVASMLMPWGRGREASATA